MQVHARGQAGTTTDAFQDVDNCIIPPGTPDWCAVVRPDRTILHDGPVADANRLVRESLALLGSA